jgi:dTDP-4-amino-4,6-dideoxygalactose transaminase
VATGVYYPVPVHRQPAYDDVDRRFPTSEGAAESVLSLPVHPALSAQAVETVAGAGLEAAPVIGGVSHD